MKATESMKSYWKQALVAVLVMGGLVAVTATPARALSLWGPTKADGSPVTGFVMPGTYTNEDPEALTGNASVCAMGPFEAPRRKWPGDVGVSRDPHTARSSSSRAFSWR